jgi:hypothetical protein
VRNLLEAGGPADRADLVRVACAVDVGARREQPLDHREMALLRRPMQRGGVVVAVAGVDVEAEAQQQVHAVEVPVGGRDVQQRSVPVAARDRDLAGMGGEQLGQRAGVAGGGRRDDLAVEALRIDARLERTPAREAVLLGDVELRLMQPGGRHAGAQRGQPLLGGLLEPIDVRLTRERLGQRVGHGAPSFSAPGVRSSRARKKGYGNGRNKRGGFDPLRGP